MGLDMYLTAKIYLSKNNLLETIKADKIRKIFPEIFKSGNLDYIEVVFEVGYWRKANAIHGWFVENAQDGTDNCGTYYVSRKQLIELKELCESVLKNKSQAQKLLPPQKGFFFGGEDLDDWYFETLQDTVQIIDKCLKLPDEWNFEYHSSW